MRTTSILPPVPSVPLQQTRNLSPLFLGNAINDQVTFLRQEALSPQLKIKVERSLQEDSQSAVKFLNTLSPGEMESVLTNYFDPLIHPEALLTLEKSRQNFSKSFLNSLYKTENIFSILYQLNTEKFPTILQRVAAIYGTRGISGTGFEIEALSFLVMRTQKERWIQLFHQELSDPHLGDSAFESARQSIIEKLQTYRIKSLFAFARNDDDFKFVEKEFLNTPSSPLQALWLNPKPGYENDFLELIPSKVYEAILREDTTSFKTKKLSPHLPQSLQNSLTNSLSKNLFKPENSIPHFSKINLRECLQLFSQLAPNSSLNQKLITINYPVDKGDYFKSCHIHTTNFSWIPGQEGKLLRIYYVDNEKGVPNHFSRPQEKQDNIRQEIVLDIESGWYVRQGIYEQGGTPHQDLSGLNIMARIGGDLCQAFLLKNGHVTYGPYQGSVVKTKYKDGTEEVYELRKGLNSPQKAILNQMFKMIHVDAKDNIADWINETRAQN